MLMLKLAIACAPARTKLEKHQFLFSLKKSFRQKIKMLINSGKKCRFMSGRETSKTGL
eukprot:UN07979